MENSSLEYIDQICGIYGDQYDDREEDSRLQGDSWQPGVKAQHKSISAFQHELKEIYGIMLSRTKIQKILISGGRWTTERSREIWRLFDEYAHQAKQKVNRKTISRIIRKIARELDISPVSVSINLPYQKTVYDLEEKTENARRIDEYRKKKNETHQRNL